MLTPMSKSTHHLLYFLAMSSTSLFQNQMQAVMETLEILSNQEEVQLLVKGLNEASEGRSKSIDEIRRSLNHSTK